MFLLSQYRRQGVFRIRGLSGAVNGYPFGFFGYPIRLIKDCLSEVAASLRMGSFLDRSIPTGPSPFVFPSALEYYD